MRKLALSSSFGRNFLLYLFRQLLPFLWFHSANVVINKTQTENHPSCCSLIFNVSFFFFFFKYRDVFRLTFHSSRRSPIITDSHGCLIDSCVLADTQMIRSIAANSIFMSVCNGMVVTGCKGWLPISDV